MRKRIFWFLIMIFLLAISSSLFGCTVGVRDPYYPHPDVYVYPYYAPYPYYPYYSRPHYWEHEHGEYRR